MKLEDQVCSLELAKELRELDVRLESLWYWAENPRPKEEQVEGELPARLVSSSEIEEECKRGRFEVECYSAFTVAELGMLLPSAWFTYRQALDWFGSLMGTELIECADTEANVRAKMLIYLTRKLNESKRLPVEESI